MGRVAAELLRSVAREAHTLLPHEIERMAHAVIDVFAAAFGQSPIQQPVSPGSHRAAQLLRIKMFIEDHLRDPELSPEQVARAHGISTRYLSKLFESAGTSPGDSSGSSGSLASSVTSATRAWPAGASVISRSAGASMTCRISAVPSERVSAIARAAIART